MNATLTSILSLSKAPYNMLSSGILKLLKQNRMTWGPPRQLCELAAAGANNCLGASRTASTKQ